MKDISDVAMSGRDGGSRPRTFSLGAAVDIGAVNAKFKAAMAAATGAGTGSSSHGGKLDSQSGRDSPTVSVKFAGDGDSEAEASKSVKKGMHSA